MSGAGDSRLADHLLDRGLTCVAVLDVSSAALARARTRLGARAAGVAWIEADVTGEWQAPPVDVWHDRAVFYFAALLGADFDLVESVNDNHQTPTGGVHALSFRRFIRKTSF